MFIKRTWYEYLTDRLTKLEKATYDLSIKNDKLVNDAYKAQTAENKLRSEADIWYHAFMVASSACHRDSDIVLHNGTPYKVVGWNIEQQPNCVETLTLECHRIVPNLEPLEDFVHD